MMSLANLFTLSSLGALFHFPRFIMDRGGSRSDIGLMMGVMALSAVLCRPWIAEMVDRIGRKRSYTLACLILGGMPLTYLLFQGNLADFYVPLFLVRIAHGIGVALAFTASFTYISDIVPEGRLNEGLGMFGTTALMGMAIGPAIGEPVIIAFGFSAYFLTAALLAICALVIHLPLPETYIQRNKVGSSSFLSVILRKKIMVVTGLALLFGVGMAAYGSFVSPYGQERGMTYVSLYYLCYSAAAILTRIVGGRLADRVGEDRILPYGFCMNGIGLLTLVFLNSPWILVLSGLITGSGHGLLFPCLNALAIREESINIRGKINGIFTGGVDAGVFLGSSTLGYVGDWLGFPVIFMIAGLALITGLLVFKAAEPAFH